MTKQKEQLDALLVGINPFNGKSRAAEISKVLDSYIPNVARLLPLKGLIPTSRASNCSFCLVS